MNEGVLSACSSSTNEALTGYLHPEYARSLAEFGTPRQLNASGSWILERSIPGTPDLDAMGCYPIFACANWSGLRADVENLPDSIVALAVVTDPFGVYDLALLSECFPHRVKPFKQHYVIDLSRELESFVR